MRRLLVLLICVLGVSGALATPAAAQAEAGGESLRGSIKNEGEPIEGVEISVSTADGEEIETVETDAEGAWLVEVPEPGDYSVELNEDTLPDGVTVRENVENPNTVTVNGSQSKPVLFAMGEGTRNVSTRFDQAKQLTVEGIKFGLIIAMAAIGLSLIFGTTGLTNFAHGELVTFGAIMAWVFHVQIGMPLVFAALLAVGAGSLFGAANDLGLWRPLRKRGTGLIAMLVISIGLSLLLRYVFLYQFGGRTRAYQDYAVQKAWRVWDISIVPRDVAVIVLSLTVLLLVGLGLQRTRFGKAMRAVADNPDLARSSGIDVERVVLVVWIIGSGLAALGGVFYAMSDQASWQLGYQLLLLMFAGVTLGGLGTAYGALVGSFVIGLVVQLSTLWIAPDLKNVVALLVLIGILLVRPQGILGARERIG
ncbi:MAG TPA: SpaA isopeptide-forming pilin-related protein [Acidimicrobiales bacterium]|nr:SpaA isopeptide-forming pilin-related protein [Acidimicrobiales bacterium]